MYEREPSHELMELMQNDPYLETLGNLYIELAACKVPDPYQPEDIIKFPLLDTGTFLHIKVTQEEAEKLALEVHEQIKLRCKDPILVQKFMDYNELHNFDDMNIWPDPSEFKA
ncbi:MAG: hypothetical protein NVSMB46_03830 [Candidatus Saccharimonadales bacterium]